MKKTERLTDGEVKAILDSCSSESVVTSAPPMNAEKATKIDPAEEGIPLPPREILEGGYKMPIPENGPFADPKERPETETKVSATGINETRPVNPADEPPVIGELIFDSIPTTAGDTQPMTRVNETVKHKSASKENIPWKIGKWCIGAAMAGFATVIAVATLSKCHGDNGSYKEAVSLSASTQTLNVVPETGEAGQKTTPDDTAPQPQNPTTAPAPNEQTVRIDAQKCRDDQIFLRTDGVYVFKGCATVR